MLKDVIPDNELLNPIGLGKIIIIFSERLMIKKRVALFSDFDQAYKDMLMEFKNDNTPEIYKGIEKAFYILLKYTYLKKWYDNL